MKRIITLILSVLMCLTVGLTATACDSEENPSSPPQASKTWAEYFDFDNVTATRTTVQNTIGAEQINYTTVETMSVQGNKWLLERRSENVLTPSEIVDLAYWDGSQIYCQIQSTLTEDSLKNIGKYWFSEVELMEYMKNDFTKTADGVYELEEKISSGSTYRNIKVVITDDNIQSVEYECTFDVSGEQVVSTVEMAFTKWGTTVVGEEQPPQPSA